MGRDFLPVKSTDGFVAALRATVKPNPHPPNFIVYGSLTVGVFDENSVIIERKILKFSLGH